MGIVGVFWTQGRQSDCYRNTEENGIETIGVVVSRYRGALVSQEQVVKISNSCFSKMDIILRLMCQVWAKIAMRKLSLE